MTRACRRSTYDKPHHCYPCLPSASTTTLPRRSNLAHSHGVLIAFSPRVHNNRRPFSLTVRRAPKRRGEKTWEFRSQVATVVERPSFDDVYTTTPSRFRIAQIRRLSRYAAFAICRSFPAAKKRTEIRVLRPPSYVLSLDEDVEGPAYDIVSSLFSLLPGASTASLLRPCAPAHSSRVAITIAPHHASSSASIAALASVDALRKAADKDEGVKIQKLEFVVGSTPFDDAHEPPRPAAASHIACLTPANPDLLFAGVNEGMTLGVHSRVVHAEECA